jgi:hypothetical protein
MCLDKVSLLHILLCTFFFLIHLPLSFDLADNKTHTRCVVKTDGLAWCVGSNEYSQLSHDSGNGDVLNAVLFDSSPARAMAVGTHAACSISCTTGETRCAGFGGVNGELGNGLNTASVTLVTALGLSSDVCTSAPSQTPTLPTSEPTVSAYN